MVAPLFHNDTQKMFSHFTFAFESDLSNVLETYTRAALLLNLSIKKKNQPKPIIRTGVTVPNVQKCVMVTTFTLYGFQTTYNGEFVTIPYMPVRSPTKGKGGLGTTPYGYQMTCKGGLGTISYGAQTIFFPYSLPPKKIKFSVFCQSAHLSFISHHTKNWWKSWKITFFPLLSSPNKFLVTLIGPKIWIFPKFF